MIRQICPHCFRSVQVPPGSAGNSVPCPVCGNVFPVPATYQPAVDPTAGPANHPRKEPAAVATDVFTERPAPPPGLVPPAGLPVPDPYAAPTEGYERSTGFTFSPRVLEWIPAICFTLIFLLTFFTWVGMYPGGYRAYSQNAWEAAFGSLDSDYFSEEVLKLEGDLKSRLGWSLFLVPYLLGLILITALCWIERVFTRDPSLIPIPAVHEFWKYRYAVIAGLAALLLILLAFQSRIGFGLERAARQRVEANHQAELDKVIGNSNAEQKVYVKQGQELGGFGLKHTSWLALVFAAHIVALAAAAGMYFIDARGDKPPPRLSLSW